MSNTNTDTIIISSNNATIVNNSSYVLNLPQAIEIRDSEVALTNFQCYYSWYNIRSSYNNNKIYVFIASQANPILITLPDGYYSAGDISGFLQNQFDILGIFYTNSDGKRVYPLSLTENKVYYAITISFIVVGTLPTGWTRGSAMNVAQDTQSIRIAFNDSFGKLVGIVGGTYSNVNTPGANNALPPNATPVSTSTSYNSSSTPQISPITAINVNTNLVNNTRFSPQYSQTIYTLNSNVSFGSIIQKDPQYPVFFPINNGFYNSISITLTDQTGLNPIPIIDNSGSIFTLVVRKKQ